MPWKYDGKIIQEGKSWSDGTYKHPYNWASAWSAEDKKKFNLVWEKEEDTNFDNRFYFSKDVAKKLDDEDAKDADGKQLYKQDGKTKLINEGLKTIWIRQTKETANFMLNKTDWYIIRASDDSTLTVPSDITAKRKAIRDASKKIEDKINACSKLADFIKLFDVPLKDGVPTGNAPIYDFPQDNL
tara:strand:- start:1503 stop:2057 length:555 start_codon:yes stop_codon:yes gene_type:complete